jgi:hypothetical protein
LPIHDISRENSRGLTSVDNIEGGSMKLMCIILSFVLLLNGCMVIHNLTTEPQSTVLTQVNEQFGGEAVTITTIRNQVYRGLFRTISSDSLRYVNDLYKAEALPTLQVYRIRSSPGASGPIWMGLGCTLAGILIGGAIGASEAEPDPNSSFGEAFGRVMAGPAYAANGAVVGGLIGLPVGVIIGSYMSAGHEVILSKP